MKPNFTVHKTPTFRVLGDDQLYEIHLSVLEVLERTGIVVQHEEARQLLKKAGCRFDGNRARYPGRLVERSILLAGEQVTQIPASSIESGGWVSPDREVEITEWLKCFPLQKQQVGCLAFNGNRILGLERLGSANLFSLLHRRILIRFIKVVLLKPAETEADPTALEAEAQNMVDAIEDADRVATKRMGLGEYWSLGGLVSGGELIYEGHLVHLSVRPAPMGKATNPTEGRSGRCS